MAISGLYQNSPTVGTAEYSCINNSTSGLAASTTACMAQIFLDLNALAAGDSFQVAVYEKVNGGTQRLAEKWTFTGVQGKPIWASPGILLREGWDYSLKKLAGTDRSIPFEIRGAS